MMKFSGTKAAKLLPLLLCGGVLALLLPYAGRPLWFDEALTVLQFAVLPSAGAIYHSYVIPNNQIIHTIFIHGLLGIAPEGFSLVFWLRMLPVFAAVLTVLVLFFRFRRICGAWAISAVLAAWIVSAPFVVFGTALRGYMLSALWTALALCAALEFAEKKGIREWLLWAVTSLLAVGTIPTNLAAVAAVVLYVLPLYGGDFYRKKQFWLMAITPVMMLVLFYAPIASAFLKCCRLGEGWPNGLAAWQAAMLPVAVSFAVLILPAVLGTWFAVRRAGFRWVYSARGMIWLLPLMACLILSVAPFPRTFFPMWPVFAVLLASAIRHFAAGWFGLHRRRSAIAFLILLIPGVLLWYSMTDFPGFRNAFSQRCGGADGDDYFAPYFMRQDFSPGMTVELISCLDPQKQGKLYCSFRADPWSVLFQLILKEYPGSYCVFDGPGGRVETLPDGAFLLLRQDESAAEAGTRFGGRLEDLGLQGGRNKLYRLMR